MQHDRSDPAVAVDPDKQSPPDDLAPPALTQHELAELMGKARKARDFLKAVAHENRLVILCLLAERERSVTELEKFLALPQSAVSQQLARLRHEGLVEARRDGRAVYYRVEDETTKRFILSIYDKFCRK